MVLAARGGVTRTASLGVMCLVCFGKDIVRRF